MIDLILGDVVKCIGVSVDMLRWWVAVGKLCILCDECNW